MQYRDVHIKVIWITVLRMLKPQKAGGRAGEEVEERVGGCGELWLSVGFKKMRGCIHPSTESRDTQAPEKAFSEELGEWGGRGGWRKKTGAPRALIMEAREGFLHFTYSFIFKKTMFFLPIRRAI